MDLLHQIIAAVRASDAGRVRELLTTDPHLVNARDETGDSLLIMTIYQELPEIREIILSARPDINIFEASAMGDTALIESHLASFPELVHAFSHDGFTALHLAVFFGHDGAVRLLLDRDADVNAVSKNQTFAPLVTPLHCAAVRGNTEFAGLLIGRGASIDARGEGGQTALHMAALRGDGAFLTVLLEAGADRAARTDGGKTPSDLARDRGHTEIAKILS